MLESGKGLFFGSFTFDIKKYQGVDFSKRVFLFPGQGSAYPGMYSDLYSDNLILKQRFTLADKIAQELKISLVSPYIHSGSEKRNFDYLTRNLALFTLEVGLFEVLISQNIKPQLLTAHSFGEYAALVAAGVVSFRDMFEIIVNRDRIARQFPLQSGMWAIRISKQEAQKIIQGRDVFIANENSPLQTVVSATLEQGKEFEKYLKENKIAFIKLDVPLAYHCSLMKEVQAEIERYIQNIQFEFKEPTIPILSSVDQKILKKESFNVQSIKKIISEQILQPVLFDSQIRQCLSMGYRNFIEVGPQKILSGFAKEILSDEIIKTRTPYDFVKTTDVRIQSKTNDVKKISNRLYGALNKAFSAVTGYEVASIKMKDRLQEDLGIDSIKKAEIVFKILEEIGQENLSGRQSIILSSLSTVDDILSYFDREQRSGDKRKTLVKDELDHTLKSLTMCWEKSSLNQFQKSLSRPLDILKVEFHDISDIPQIRTSIQNFLFRSETKPKLVQLIFKPEFKFDKEKILHSSSSIVDWLIQFSNSWGTIRVTSPWNEQNIHFQFIYHKGDRYLSEVLRPFMKSWVLEQGSMTGKIIELDSFEEAMLLELQHEVIEPYHSFIQYNNGQRFVLDLVPIKQKKEFQFKDRNVYMILGGHKGIGLEISKSIPKDKNSTIILIGRTARQDQDITKVVAQLSNENTRVEYFQCDAREKDQLKIIFDSVLNKYGKIDYVVNSIGVTISKFLHFMTSEEVTQILTSKFSVATNLATLLLENKSQTNVLHFSSVAGYFGTQGQAVYALANSAVNVLAEILDEQGGSRFQSILWGPWKNTGMTEDQLLQAYIDIVGLTYIDPKLGSQFAWNMFSTKESVVTVLDESSRLRYQVGAVDKKSYRQLYSNTQTVYLGESLDVEGLTLQNLPFLRDHKLAGQPIVAASTMLALYAQFGYVLWGQIPMIRNFIGHNFIIIPEAMSQLTLGIKRSPQKVNLQLISTFIHSEAQVLLNQNQAAEIKNFQIPKYKDQLDNDMLTNSVIETGPAYDFTSKVWANSKTKDVVVEFRTQDLPYCTEMPLFDRLYQMIEIAHQSLGLTSQWKTGKYSIPKSIQSFQLFQNVEVTEKLFSVHDTLTISDKYIQGDSYIVNEKEEVLIQLKGVQFAFLPQTANIQERFKFLKSN